MNDPFEELSKDFYFNFYEGKSERAPILTIALKNKTTGEVFKRPVWRSKEQGKFPYLGKAETPQDTSRPSTDDQNIPF